MVNWVDVYLEIYFVLNFRKPRWYEKLPILIFFEGAIILRFRDCSTSLNGFVLGTGGITLFTNQKDILKDQEKKNDRQIKWNVACEVTLVISF